MFTIVGCKLSAPIPPQSHYGQIIKNLLDKVPADEVAKTITDVGNILKEKFTDPAVVNALKSGGSDLLDGTINAGVKTIPVVLNAANKALDSNKGDISKSGSEALRGIIKTGGEIIRNGSDAAGQETAGTIHNFVEPISKKLMDTAPRAIGHLMKSCIRYTYTNGIPFLCSVGPIYLAGSLVFLGGPVFCFWYAPRLAYAYVEKRCFAPKTISYQTKYEQTLTMADFVANTRTKKWLSRYIDMINYAKENDYNMPHLFFCGAPGVGKTFVSDIIANETGLKIVKLNIKSLEGTKSPTDELLRIVEWCKRKKYILMIDECDQVIASRQKNGAKMSEFSRGVMTELLKVTGSKQPNFEGFFIFITNTANDIDDAILSRTLPLEFDYPDKKSMSELLTKRIVAAKASGAPYKLTKSFVEKMTEEMAKKNEILAQKVTEVGFDFTNVVVSGRELASMEEFIRLGSLGKPIDEELFNSLRKDFMEILAIKAKYSSDMYTKIENANSSQEQ